MFDFFQNEGVCGREWEERSTHTCPGQKEQSVGWKGKMYGYVEL